jgi:Domain of unknown function (DUF4157)
MRHDAKVRQPLRDALWPWREDSSRHGRALLPQERDIYRHYFAESVLDAVRILDGAVPCWLRRDMVGVTLRHRVCFRPGCYQLETPAGIELLGHELKHVEQFGAGMTYWMYLRASTRGYARNLYEIEARAMGARIRRDVCGPAEGA